MLRVSHREPMKSRVCRDVSLFYWIWSHSTKTSLYNISMLPVWRVACQGLDQFAGVLSFCCVLFSKDQQHAARSTKTQGYSQRCRESRNAILGLTARRSAKPIVRRLAGHAQVRVQNSKQSIHNLAENPHESIFPEWSARYPFSFVRDTKNTSLVVISKFEYHMHLYRWKREANPPLIVYRNRKLS